jgi:omega-6 fatty acid desaturase (delta-12 desaturase)
MDKTILARPRRNGIDAAAMPPPELKAVRHLQPRDIAGWSFFGLACGLTAIGSGLALSGTWLAWAIGQLLLAFAFVQWFVLLHEAGHHTLFRTRSLNRVAGWISGFFALIPYPSWQRIHARHHRWTGWQDLDATTASLVPRPLASWERFLVDSAWKTGLPLFSLIYRLSNYWHVRRLAAYLRPAELGQVKFGVAVTLATYGVLAAAVGPTVLIQVFALGRLLAFAIEDPLLLSQHTHIPQRLAGATPARPFNSFEQQAFTRSLRLPAFFSRLILHFDAHELHHMYVRVPGYDLRRIEHRPDNEVDWWTWLKGAKKLRGSVFLFQNREQTGFDL